MYQKCTMLVHFGYILGTFLRKNVPKVYLHGCSLGTLLVHFCQKHCKYRLFGDCLDPTHIQDTMCLVLLAMTPIILAIIGSNPISGLGEVPLESLRQMEDLSMMGPLALPALPPLPALPGDSAGSKSNKKIETVKKKKENETKRRRVSKRPAAKIPDDDDDDDEALDDDEADPALQQDGLENENDGGDVDDAASASTRGVETDIKPILPIGLAF